MSGGAPSQVCARTTPWKSTTLHMHENARSSFEEERALYQYGSSRNRPAKQLEA